MSKRSVAVVGAGAAGLAAAFDLARAGLAVTVLESDVRVGGLASGFQEANWEWSLERFYHHWFESDRHIMRLIDELGVRHRVMFRRPVTALFHEGAFFPFDSAVAALRYPGLGHPFDKVRFGLSVALLRATKKWRLLERYTADGWMRAIAGESAYREIWEPLMVGKFGEADARRVNMAWLWARIHVRTARLGTFEGGFQAFMEHLAGELRDLGVSIRLATPVTRIESSRKGEIHVTTPNALERFDRCLVTLSPGLLASLTPDLPPHYLESLLRLRSRGAVVLILALREPLSPEGYYWYNLPKAAGFPFLCLVEHTNFVDREHFGGDTIVYLGDYREAQHEYFEMTHEDLLAVFLPSLRRINPRFRANWVRKSWLHRATYAQPIPLVGHSRNLPDIRTPLPGLFFASMSQVYPWDRGTNYAVEIGRRAALMMLGDPE